MVRSEKLRSHISSCIRKRRWVMDTSLGSKTLSKCHRGITSDKVIFQEVHSRRHPHSEIVLRFTVARARVLLQKFANLYPVRQRFRLRTAKRR